MRYPTASSFYSDGFHDASNGMYPSPPDPYTRDDGETTDVYAEEYMRGYTDGKARVRAQAKEAQLKKPK